MKTQRTLLFFLSLLVLWASPAAGSRGYSATPRRAERGRAGTAEPVTPGEGPEGTGGEGQPTEGVRRLELPITPTPFHVTDQDDPLAAGSEPARLLRLLRQPG